MNSTSTQITHDKVDASPIEPLEVKNVDQGQGEEVVITDTSNSSKINDTKIGNGLRKLIQQLTGPGEISESERRRRRAANKRSRVSRKRNQKLARLKKGKVR
jgi:hypothetical protein